MNETNKTILCYGEQEINNEAVTLAQQTQELTRKLLVLDDIVRKIDKDLFFNDTPCCKLEEPKCLSEEVTMQYCIVEDICGRLRKMAEMIC